MKEPNPRRFAVWAASLVLPLVAGAFLVPRLFRPPTLPAAALAPADPAARDAAGTPPRHPEQPTSEELEKARWAATAHAALEKRNLEKAEVFAPRDDAGDAWRPFDGFGLSIDSAPEGAHVTVNGQELGGAPVLTSISCQPGEDVVVRAVAKGYRPFERKIACRKDAILAFTARLVR
ncbi:MAG: PEGA domain-containing protein [Anaeromyxobacteraceae bacterium]